MKKILLAAATVLCTSSFAVAEPVLLTDTQMDSITAARRSGDVNVNISILRQSADARAVAIAGRFGYASATAVASNRAEVDQEND